MKLLIKYRSQNTLIKEDLDSRPLKIKIFRNHISQKALIKEAEYHDN